MRLNIIGKCSNCAPDHGEIHEETHNHTVAYVLQCINDISWSSLVSLPHLVVDLRWNNIGLLGGRSLLEALQQNKALVQLEMAGNNIPSDTLKALGKVSTRVH